MQTGQVIAMSHFTMLDAMNAIEVSIVSRLLSH